MVVKRTFNTKLEPVDAFGLANELLRPRGFTLDKGNPPRSQAWRRGVEPGKKSRSVFTASQDLQVEFDRGRVNVTATAGVSGKRSALAQKMLTGYAEALERLMATGEPPKAATAPIRRAEASIKRTVLGKRLSICAIVLALLGGGGYFASTNPNIPSPMKWFGKGLAEGKKKGAPPVVIVRRAGGAQSNASPQSSHTP